MNIFLKLKRKLLALTIAFVMLLSLMGCGSADSVIKFGAAGVGGVYSTFANAYAQLASEEGMEIAVKSTAGSVANLRLLSENYIQFAIAQADLTHDAYYGLGSYENKPLTGYSAVAALYTEACQIIVKADSSITSVEDLLHGTVSVGAENSGSERNALQILQAYGLSKDLVSCQNLDYADAAEALKNGQIDAMFCTTGTPTSVVEGLSEACDIRLLSLDDEHIHLLESSYDFFSTYVIDAGTYKGQDGDVTTVGVQALLLANDTLDNATVEKLTGILFDKSQGLQYGVTIDLQLDPKAAVDNATIPLHPGALAYYESQGITVVD